MADIERSNELLHELGEISEPTISLPSLLLIMADHIEHSGSNMDFVRSMCDLYFNPQPEMTRNELLIMELISESLESSTQIHDVIRAAGIEDELRTMDLNG